MVSPMARPENASFNLRSVQELTHKGHPVELINTAAMTDDARYAIYLHEAVPAAGNRYRVGRPFGSNRNKGEDLGTHVPALIVYGQEGTLPADVYPHEEHDGRIVTIADFVTELD
jgi:hypothetical protein